MSWQRSPLFLGAWLLSLFLLVLFVLLLMWREKAPGIPMPIVDATPATGATEKFPGSFGSLGDLVPFAGGITPVATEVIPAEHGPEFRDAAWVAAQNPDSYTLQVMAVHDEGAVKRFLAGREDRAQFVYFINPQEGADWYVVTTGSFASRELAMGVADSHDFGLATKPFPKRVGVYQEAIASAAARPSVPVAPPGGGSTPSANAPSAL